MVMLEAQIPNEPHEAAAWNFARDNGIIYLRGDRITDGVYFRNGEALDIEATQTADKAEIKRRSPGEK